VLLLLLLAATIQSSTPPPLGHATSYLCVKSTHPHCPSPSLSPSPSPSSSYPSSSSLAAAAAAAASCSAFCRCPVLCNPHYMGLSCSLCPPLLSCPIAGLEKVAHAMLFNPLGRRFGRPFRPIPVACSQDKLALPNLSFARPLYFKITVETVYHRVPRMFLNPSRCVGSIQITNVTRTSRSSYWG